MRLGITGVFVMAAAVLMVTACASMDEPIGTPYEHEASAVILDQETGVEYQVVVSYDSSVTVHEAMVLLSNIGITHDHGVTVTTADSPAVAPGEVLASSPHWNQFDPTHGFEVSVYSVADDLSQQIDDTRWEWIRLDATELAAHCPPGHGVTWGGR